MSYIKWSDDLRTGNTQIDNDHKHLIDLVNQLHDAMKAGQGHAILAQVLSELITYTASHFSREERYMQQINYTGYEEHKHEHEKLVKEVLDLQQRFKAGSTTLSVNVFSFLSAWLTSELPPKFRLPEVT